MRKSATTPAATAPTAIRAAGADTSSRSSSGSPSSPAASTTTEATSPPSAPSTARSLSALPGGAAPTAADSAVPKHRDECQQPQPPRRCVVLTDDRLRLDDRHRAQQRRDGVLLVVHPALCRRRTTHRPHGRDVVRHPPRCRRGLCVDRQRGDATRPLGDPACGRRRTTSVGFGDEPQPSQCLSDDAVATAPR